MICLVNIWWFTLIDLLNHWEVQDPKWMYCTRSLAIWEYVPLIFPWYSNIIPFISYFLMEISITTYIFQCIIVMTLGKISHDAYYSKMVISQSQPVTKNRSKPRWNTRLPGAGGFSARGNWRIWRCQRGRLGAACDLGKPGFDGGLMGFYGDFMGF